MEDFGNFLLEVEYVQFQSGRPHLQDIGHFRHLARGHHNGVADSLPHINGIDGIQIEQVAPMAPRSRRDAALVLQAGKAVGNALRHMHSGPKG